MLAISSYMTADPLHPELIARSDNIFADCVKLL
jgi:hypothetical protein